MTEYIFGCPYDINGEDVTIFNPFFLKDNLNNWTSVTLHNNDIITITRINPNGNRKLPKLRWRNRKFTIVAESPPAIVAHKIEGVLHLVT